MKTKIVLLLMIVTLAIALWLPTSRNYLNVLLSTSLCDQPLQYKIGSVDSRFDLSQQEVSNDIQQATDLWSNAYDKPLFEYNPEANLTVNFIYDQRQQLDTQIENLKQQLDTKNQNLQQQINSYYQQSTAFKTQLAQFNNEVTSWNEKGGAPQDVYNQLTQEQQSLQTEGTQLDQKAKELNLSTSDYNGQVGTLNQDVNQFNTDLNIKPEEGLWNPNNDTITIYFATNHAELIHTLTHEFGHSLGMVHVKDPNAIMYPYTTQNIVITPDDMSQLNYVCRKQDIFIIWDNDIKVWLSDFIQAHFPSLMQSSN